MSGNEKKTPTRRSKTLKECWDPFIVACCMSGISQDQYEAMRVAFYAGAHAAMMPLDVPHPWREEDRAFEEEFFGDLKK